MSAPTRAVAPGIVLRDMAERDLARVAELETELFASESWSRQVLEDELARAQGPEADRRYVVLEEAAGELVGYAGLWFGDGHGQADLLTLATVARRRHQGLATAMMAELVATACTAGCHAVLLEVRASNTAARALYSGYGFEEIGSRRRYYDHPAEDAVVMRLPCPGRRRPGAVGAEALAP